MVENAAIGPVKARSVLGHPPHSAPADQYNPLYKRSGPVGSAA